MIRGVRLNILLACSLSALTASNVYPHGGGGGGHGGGGGGHMGGGGGHMGGFSGGHVGGGYSAPHMGGGGYSPTHMGGGYYSGQHMGAGTYGPTHMGGSTYGGTQHIGTQNYGVQHMGTQHMGTQNLGTMTHSATQHQLNSTFYHNHGLMNGNGTTANSHIISNHQSSQFLSNHALSHNSGLNHSGNLLNHGQGSFGSHASSQFLSQHQLSGTSVTAAHHGNFTAAQGAFNHNHNAFANNSFANHSGFNQNHNWNHGQNWNHNHNWNNGYYGSGPGYWNYPYYGYGSGFGFGLGLGLGYGLGYGFGFGGLGYFGGYGLGYYGGYYGGYGLGYYGLGGYYGGYGYGLNGYGYPMNGYGYGMYNNYYCGAMSYLPYCAYQPVGYGYANGSSSYGLYSGYGGYGYPTTYGVNSSSLAYGNSSLIQGLGPAIATDAAPAVTPSTVTPENSQDTTSGAASGMPTADEFARIGETAFKARDYKGAARAWRHGLVDDPQNGVLILMLSQALFANQQFSESAGAIQAAVQTLPQDKWDVVIKNFRDLYGKGEDYTTQLRALEKVAREKTDDASLRFLLGYHYGFLGYPADAVKQLDKCLAIVPQDEVARKLLKIFSDKLPKKSEDSIDVPTSTNSGTLPPAAGDQVPPPLNPEPSRAGLTKAPAEVTLPAKP